MNKKTITITIKAKKNERLQQEHKKTEMKLKRQLITAQLKNTLLTKQVKELKQEVKSLKTQQTGQHKSTDASSCYACSTVDNAKYDCESCGVKMCLDHCQDCYYCGKGQPHCTDCMFQPIGREYSHKYFHKKCLIREEERKCAECKEPIDPTHNDGRLRGSGAIMYSYLECCECLDMYCSKCYLSCFSTFSLINLSNVEDVVCTKCQTETNNINNNDNNKN
jgi:hypothetical protein